MTEVCVICGEIIPEGRQVCPNCERKSAVKREKADEIMKAIHKLPERDRIDFYMKILDFYKKVGLFDLTYDEIIAYDQKTNANNYFMKKFTEVN